MFEKTPEKTVGFDILRYSLDKGAFAPLHAHKEDAGYDLRTPQRVVVRKRDSRVIDTGVHFEIPEGYYGKIEGRSGLNVNHGIASLGGVVDAGYSGSVVVKIYNLSDVDYIFKPGDKIAQIVFHRIATPEELVEVEGIRGGERGASAFGSTGR